MGVEGLLQSVVRFSNFMTARLIVSGLVFFVLSGFTETGSASVGLLPNFELLNSFIRNYQDILGVSDFTLLLIFFLFLTALYATVALYRPRYRRVEKPRNEVVYQVLGFASIWTSPAYQQRVAAACVPSRDLTPASFEILMPIYGTFDAFLADMRKWRRMAPDALPTMPQAEEAPIKMTTEI